MPPIPKTIVKRDPKAPNTAAPETIVTVDLDPTTGTLVAKPPQTPAMSPNGRIHFKLGANLKADLFLIPQRLVDSNGPSKPTSDGWPFEGGKPVVYVEHNGGEGDWVKLASKPGNYKYAILARELTSAKLIGPLDPIIVINP